MPVALPRRDFLYGLGATLGTVALNALLRADESGAASPAGSPSKPGPLAVKPAHHPAQAKNCIFLFMEGGPSHIDTFDPKPKLDELHMQEFTRQDKFASAMASGGTIPAAMTAAMMRSEAVSVTDRPAVANA